MYIGLGPYFHLSHYRGWYDNAYEPMNNKSRYDYLLSSSFEQQWNDKNIHEHLQGVKMGS